MLTCQKFDHNLLFTLDDCAPILNCGGPSVRAAPRLSNAARGQETFSCAGSSPSIEEEKL